jgi:hypothetical protein
MPSPTDLVTDLPADFEVFGQAVDTDFVDLLGGANGYILSKASATDLDFAWIPNDQGDITGITATSPITGGGSSGAITIGINAATTSVVGAVQLSDSTSTTSSVLASTPTATKAAYDLADAAIAKSVVTTAGDIIYRNATVPVRLGIGTAGQVLKVNSGATAPEWGAAASGALTLVKVVTFSASSSIDLSDSFSTTYDNYVLLGTYTASADGDLQFRYRVGGADNSTTEYNYQVLDINATTVGALRLQGQSSGRIAATRNGLRVSVKTDFLSPFLTATKNWIGNAAVATGNTVGQNNISGGFHTATSFTGLTVYPSSGNVTGTIRVYGYSNS